MPDDKPRLTDDEQRNYVEALETLPLLTRTVFLLASRDSFPYAEIGWRCGISVDEVQVRVADALLGLDRHMRVRPTFIGRIRRALLPWRDAWATARAREGDRRLAPWLSPQKRPGRRSAIDWIAWAFEHTLR
ncbi:sigma-70 region 4 domain-containing protein [Sphingomonas sp. JC676]|uniref:sigma factor-like helix-turn-helix DNA-binding protein n=1 Tax=Sphingomonas sp. JC676 TaxID=2768065 RepID=UPI001657EB23|nr:sigma-70 region 4 domain-containing protein [Sphingomonas sp. JC676]MBC9031836.1 sigma-70 region 4 domain-containing protein [Sphingomonas sp. JC676]